MLVVGDDLLRKLLLLSEQDIPSPHTEKSFLLRSATCAPGRTFRNYVGHLRKGCALSGAPSEWETKAVCAAAVALRKAKKGKFKSPNFLFWLAFLYWSNS